MGKIAPNPYGYKPEEDEEEIIPNDETPAFEAGEGEDEPVMETEGESVEESEEEPVETTPEEKPKYTFASEDELQDFIKTQNKARQPFEQIKTEPITKKEEKDPLEDLTFWKGAVDENGKWTGESPKDWNDFARTIIKYSTSEDQKKSVASYIKGMSDKEKTEMENINAEFDAEYDTLVAQKLVPKRGTKEGDATNLAISSFGSKYGLTSIKTSYELWSSLPKEKGGGFNQKPIPRKLTLQS